MIKRGAELDCCGVVKATVPLPPPFVTMATMERTS